MRELVKDLINAKISRRGFLAGMAVASYSTAAARSALAAVEPFIPGGALPEGYVRMATGTGAELLLDQILETGASVGPEAGVLIDDGADDKRQENEQEVEKLKVNQKKFKAQHLV